VSSNELAMRRKALGLTLQELAAEFGVQSSTVWRWETGASKLTGPAAVGVDVILKRLERTRARRPPDSYEEA
jgi:DNA-binding transcriptional regulator YiaG